VISFLSDQRTCNFTIKTLKSEWKSSRSALTAHTSSTRVNSSARETSQRYRIGRNQVYKLYDEEAKRYIAIRRVVKSESDMADILKERKINEELQKVTSNNILEIFEIIDTAEFVWYLTEYCSGGSLW
jgi:serine/threonine protein kinase